MRKFLSILSGLLLFISVDIFALAADAGSANNAPPAPAKRNNLPLDSTRFLADAFQGGLAEIQLSKLAAAGTSNNDVRLFAQQMIEDHTRTNNELMQLAVRKHVTLPNELNEEQKALVERLSTLPGLDSDQAYMDINVELHEKDLTEFNEQSFRGADPEVRYFAANTVPILEAHLALAERINDKLDPADFLADAFKGGQAEIQLSKLALKKSSSNEVKDFAQRMIDDHSRANQEIKALAQKKNIALPDGPSAEQQIILQQLSRLSGQDFDQAYMDVNVVAHQKNVEKFQDQSAQGRDPEIKGFAANTLPALSAHLEMAKALDEKIKPEFLFEAYRDGRAEIVLAHLALLKTSNVEVRDFAKKMIADHMTANSKIIQLARQKNIALTRLLPAQDKLAFAGLLQLSGADFDKAYMNINVGNHEKAVSEFRQESEQGTDADTKAFAGETLPTLTMHLALAREIAGRLGTM